MGHPYGGRLVQSSWRIGYARRWHECSGFGLCNREMGRVAAQICASGCRRPRLLSVTAGVEPGQCGAANLLVHGFHLRHGEAKEPGQQHGRRGRHASVADGAIAAWSLLEGWHEAWLSGCGLVDAVQINARRSSQRCMALCAVHGVEDGVAQEEPCRPHHHPGFRHRS
jgi:hypothetical protein